MSIITALVYYIQSQLTLVLGTIYLYFLITYVKIYDIIQAKY
jgi:hypothetical protein